MSQWSLNQTRYSLSSLKLYVGGLAFIGTQKCSATETLDGDLMYGNGVTSIGKVIGKLSSDIELGFIPEEFDRMVQAAGVGFAEVPISFSASFFEPASSSGLYTVSNDSIWFGEQGIDAAREGAIVSVKFKGAGIMNWNGVTCVDLAARASDPASVGALFAAAGLSLAL